MTEEFYKTSLWSAQRKAKAGMVVLRLVLTDSLIPAILFAGIGSMAWQLFDIHFQKLFTYGGSHHWFGRKLILLPFLCRLQLHNPFVVGFKITTAFTKQLSTVFLVGRLCAAGWLSFQKYKEDACF